MGDYRIAPLVPTEEMLLKAGKSPSGVSPRGGTDWLGKMLPKYYRAMMTAAPYPPPGLLLSLGDGSAVPVTAEMVARHRWERHVPWERISEAAREHEIERAQTDLDALVTALIQQAQEARDA